MKKTIRDIGITFVIMGIICFAFWQIGWITSTKELFVMFVITCTVIAFELFTAWIWKRLKKRFQQEESQ